MGYGVRHVGVVGGCSVLPVMGGGEIQRIRKRDVEKSVLCRP